MDSYVDNVDKSNQNRVAMFPRITASPDVIEGFCKRWHIIEMSLFGSMLREDYNSDSDIDVMIQFDLNNLPGFAYTSMVSELKELLGKPVDIVTRASVERSLNYIRRKEVLNSAEVIYENR